jgi:hypothetical protein
MDHQIQVAFMLLDSGPVAPLATFFQHRRLKAELVHQQVSVLLRGIFHVHPQQVPRVRNDPIERAVFHVGLQATLRQG